MRLDSQNIIILKEKERYFSEIKSDGLTNWGDWGLPEFCPYNHYAVGYNSKIEHPPTEGNDDTALNSIRLICSDASFISSSNGYWGNWGENVYCENNTKLSGFAMKSQEIQVGEKDDTAANAIKFYCSDKELFNKNEAQWGRWGKLILCPNNTGICGLKTQVEMAQDKGDDTALNNVIFYCCS